MWIIWNNNCNIKLQNTLNFNKQKPILVLSQPLEVSRFSVHEHIADDEKAGEKMSWRVLQRSLAQIEGNNEVKGGCLKSRPGAMYHFCHGRIVLSPRK